MPPRDGDHVAGAESLGRHWHLADFDRHRRETSRFRQTEVIEEEHERTSYDLLADGRVVITTRIEREVWNHSPFAHWPQEVEAETHEASIGELLDLDLARGPVSWRHGNVQGWGSSPRIQHRVRAVQQRKGSGVIHLLRALLPPTTTTTAARGSDRRGDQVSEIAAVSVPGHHGEVFVISSGRLEHRWFMDGLWSDWTSVPLPEGTRARAVAAAAHGPYVDLFVALESRRLIHNWWGSEGGWHGWDDWADEVDGVAATSFGAGHVEVYWSSGSRTFHQWHQGGTWHERHEFDR